ncbi:hypothetical protein [Streptomyces sp. NPDC048603]|uniref:hypothetical protein n=1 Tax=Streptomyces sp. NPDC048603 TaxID=3365577 RepID=UPI003723A823
MRPCSRSARTSWPGGPPCSPRHPPPALVLAIAFFLPLTVALIGHLAGRVADRLRRRTAPAWRDAAEAFARWRDALEDLVLTEVEERLGDVLN